MAERGRSPGAKGTAFPFAQRAQKAVPGGRPSKAGGGGKPAGAPWAGAGKPAGKPLARPGGASPVLQKNTASATAPAVAAADGLVRVSKLLAERGLCSRREADRYIEMGWVLVDGERLNTLGARARPDARLALAPEAHDAQERRVTVLLHKPVGYVSGQPEPGYEPAVTLITADRQEKQPVGRGADEPVFRPAMLKGLAPAGRLDIDSTGLLVLTQDGRIARQLIGEDSAVEKEYLVRVSGELDANGLALLNHGLSLDGVALKPAKVKWLNEDQLQFILREGKKRQIRRMCELVGLKVVGLKRVRMGRVRLGDLPLGQWRFLRADERF